MGGGSDSPFRIWVDTIKNDSCEFGVKPGHESALIELDLALDQAFNANVTFLDGLSPTRVQLTPQGSTLYLLSGEQANVTLPGQGCQGHVEISGFLIGRTKTH